MRSKRLEALIKAALLLATGFFLYGRIANGTLYYYINERFAGFTLFGVVGLIAVGLAYHFGRRPMSAQGDHQEHAQAHAHDHAHTHDHTHDHGHDHEHTGHSHALSWGGALIVALPVILGLAVPPRPLGVAALDNREFNLNLDSSALPASLRNATEKAAADRNILDWSRTFQQSTDYASLAGQEARVIGFVYHEPSYGDDHFVITRFIVSCCVADASVVGMLVRKNDFPVEDDQWVEISGKLIPSTLENWRPPILAAETITPVEVPRQPYLYP